MKIFRHAVTKSPYMEKFRKKSIRLNYFGYTIYFISLYMDLQLYCTMIENNAVKYGFRVYRMYISHIFARKIHFGGHLGFQDWQNFI